MAGQTFTDDYLWLEDRGSDEVKLWAHEQTVHTDTVLRRDAALIAWQERLLKAYQKGWRGAPVASNGLLFYREQSEDAPMPTLYVEENGSRRALIAPGDTALHGHASLEDWEPSPDGRFLAYTTMAPDEIQTLRIREIATNRDIGYSVTNVWGSLAWTDDSRQLYYVRSDEDPKNHDTFRQWQKACRHDMDNPDDRVIFSANGRDDYVAFAYAPGSPGIAITTAPDWTGNDVYYYDFASGRVSPVIVGYTGSFRACALPEHIVIMTDYHAERGRLLSIGYDEIGRDISCYTDSIAKSDWFMVHYDISESYVFITYRRDMAHEVEIYDRHYIHIRTLDIPAFSTCYVSTDIRNNTVYVSSSGTVNPGTIHLYDPKADRSSVWYEVPQTFAPEGFEVSMHHADSADGTTVPMLLVRKAGAAGPRPLILYGYGGFDDTQEVFYMSSALAWCDAGGSFAWAVLRGDGNYGRAWHDGGRLDHKQSTFDDLAACAQSLIADGHTTSDMLGLNGGSNGGLTVAAVATQHPDSIKAVASEVPLLDMVRYADFLIGATWKTEYGDPHDPHYLENIRSWSPYQNISADTRYPSFYLAAAEHDTRVHPLHAYKMAARLQALRDSPLTLLDVIGNSGHLGANDRFAAIRNVARRYAFFAWQLGLNERISED